MREMRVVEALRAGISLGAALVVSACGGGGEGQDVTAPLSVGAGELVETIIIGSVGDGPITSGRVVIHGTGGDILATQQSNDQARYRIALTIPRGDFPVTVGVSDGTDIVTGDSPSFALLSAVLEPGGERVANLNPAGTLAVKIAQHMTGGLSRDNLASATRIVNSQLGFGIDARGITDSISANISAQNAASMVRSSEALGEMIRRTLDALTTGGQSMTADELVDVLSIDLVDGSIDGQGPTGVDSRIAATANVVSAQVMLETMTNRLEVGGVAATGALDAAVQQISGGDLTVPLTATLNTTESMLTQARVLVDAATRIDPSPTLAAVGDALAALQPGQSPSQLASQLPPDAADALNGTIMQAILASDEELAAVNDAVRAAQPPDETVVNRLPTISGTPTPSVSAGSAYLFVPIATDADGDTLTFSITGAPAWADFDTATGRLSGTPDEVAAGIYPAIEIAVTDGFGAVSLAPFSVTVTASPNRPPTISGVAPGIVTIGNRFVFTPTASDADGDTLTFSIAGLPTWASFDAGSGRVSGVPGLADVGTYTGIQITVSDGEDRASLSPFSVSVSGLPNQAPVISGAPPTQVMVGNSYVFAPAASDLDGDVLTFAIDGLPAWAAFNSGTGRLSGTPAAGSEGVYPGIRVSVTDGQDTASLPLFSITVEALPNSAPVIWGTPDGSVTVGSAYSFTPSASDAEGNILTFSIAGRPSWASFDAASGRLSGTPAAGDQGVWPGIRISVSDGQATVSLAEFSIVVDALPNTAPTITGSPTSSVTAGAAYEFTPTASDADGDNLDFSITGRPAWASFSSASGRLSGTPVTADIGTYADIRISVSDGRDSVDLPAFAIDVLSPPNRAPTISGSPATSVTVGSAYSFAPTANDPDGDPVVFSIAGMPVWASFDSGTGRLSGTPTAAHVGMHAGIVISVSDGEATTSMPAFDVVVSSLPNQAPTISGTPPTAVTVDAVYDFQPVAADSDGDSLSFSIAGLPVWASFDTGSGRLSGVPAVGDEGAYPGIRISVSDGKDTASLAEFAITVNALPNNPPTISGSPGTSVTVASAYSFRPIANDADGDNLSFSIAGLPGWATFDVNTGELSGTPAVGDEGVWSGIRISVSDDQEIASLPVFAITVNALPNVPPTITGSPSTQVTAESQYSFTPAANDADGDALSFSIAGKPAWAGFNSGTGQLIGTPATGDEGVYGGIVISVSDGEDSASLPAFAITVTERPNQPPVISGAPATEVIVGSAYSFRPAASDADGDSLTFSVTSMPAWASFDTSTGQLSGTPADGEEGVYPGISISVSDGRDTASLPTFAVTVNEVPNSPPTISGTPSTTATVGDGYSFTPGASDADGDSLTFSIASMPAWASFDTGTGRLSGTPGAGDEGAYPGIRISVSDGRDSTSLPAFTISVEGLPNQPPTIGGIPAAEVTIGSAYSFTPTASDPDGDALSFTVTGLPAWASFDAGTGRLSGTPAAGDEGTYSGIVIAVSDGSASVSLDTFSVAVVAQTLGFASLSWDAPAENADGTIIDDLKGFRVYYGTEIGAYPNVVDIGDPTITTHLVENLVPGTWYFVVTAYDTSGNESVYSDLASKVIP